MCQRIARLAYRRLCRGLDFQKLGFTHAQAPHRQASTIRAICSSFISTVFDRIRSSRRLEAEAGRNLELMWLLRGLRPDFKTSPTSAKTTVLPSFPLQHSSVVRQMGLFGPNWSP